MPLAQSSLTKFSVYGCSASFHASSSSASRSAFGIDGNLVTTNHEYHSTLLLKVLEVAKKRYLLADRSKFNRSGLFRLGTRADFDRIISD